MAIFDGGGDLHTTIAEMDIAARLTPTAVAAAPAATAAAAPVERSSRGGGNFRHSHVTAVRIVTGTIII